MFLNSRNEETRATRLQQLLKELRRFHCEPCSCLLSEEDTVSKEEGKKHFTFQLPPAPSPLPSSPGLVSKERRRKGRGSASLSFSSYRSSSTFMHETQRKIESIHWPFRQWRKEILRALLDMKIYNKNQFLASLCSLNDKASTHSAIVCRKVILQHRPRQERRILSDLRLQILIWYRPTEIIGGT